MSRSGLLADAEIICLIEYCEVVLSEKSVLTIKYCVPNMYDRVIQAVMNQRKY